MNNLLASCSLPRQQLEEAPSPEIAQQMLVAEMRRHENSMMMLLLDWLKEHEGQPVTIRMTEQRTNFDHMTQSYRSSRSLLCQEGRVEHYPAQPPNLESPSPWPEEEMRNAVGRVMMQYTQELEPQPGEPYRRRIVVDAKEPENG